MSGPKRNRLSTAQIQSLTAVTEPWLSCDECFDQIDTYVGRLADGTGGLDEPLRVHLANCPACYDEAESLISLTAEDDDTSASALLATFQADLDRDNSDPPARGWIGRLRRRRRSR